MLGSHLRALLLACVTGRRVRAGHRGMNARCLPPIGNRVRDVLMILFVTLTTLCGQVPIKDAVAGIAARASVPSGSAWAWAVAGSPKIWASIAVQALGFLAWAAVLSRMKLGPAYASFGAFFYLLLAITGWWLYDERLAPVQWLGVVLVSLGVVLMSLAGTQS